MCTTHPTGDIAVQAIAAAACSGRRVRRAHQGSTTVRAAHSTQIPIPDCALGQHTCCPADLPEQQASASVAPVYTLPETRRHGPQESRP